MKQILGILFSLIAIANLVVGRELSSCENLTDITRINEGYNYIEGDILIPLENLDDFITSTDPYSPQNAVARNTAVLWENGLVPYELSSSLSQVARNAIITAMEFYVSRSCIEFVVRTTEPNWLYFFPGRGCYSYIGNIQRGGQEVSIGQGCEYPGIVKHEIFHALARWHEQSRPDRDQYINIHLDNIIDSQESNFERVSSDVATTQGLPYDFGSIMHYRDTAFTSNGQRTITTLDPANQNLIGQRDTLSDTDMEHVNILYSCGERSPMWSDWSEYSSCPENCRDYMRNRTRTCIGGGCPGNFIEFLSCGSEACSTLSSWGTWGEWTQCSVSCNTGYRYRTRVCQNGNDCPGLYYEIDRTCGSNPCIVATWSEWSEYGSCSLTCGGGSMTRTRECSVENVCVGPTTQTIACATNPCIDDEEIISNSLRALGCFQYLDTSNLFYYNNGTTFQLDIEEIAATRRAIVKCSQSAISRNRLFFAMIDGYCMQEGGTDISIRPFVHTTALDRCSNQVGSYDNQLAMDLWYIYDVSGITARVRRDTFLDGNNTNVEEMEAEACGINMGVEGSGNGVGNLAPNLLYAMIALLVLLVLQY
ncbi:Zinc metalloproteinase nas-14-like [Oopsacas minuta]|uniref:Metalloendopeptidase n=1 Tax=Oopsacas minuta TaxID=111878 RepID=A0AAV7JVK5_9METZ|nr:Zinc metalloproteinase nas-14-like [Oopsacas minuta]